MTHQKGLNLRPLLGNLRKLSDWADGNLDDNPFPRHIRYLTTSTYSYTASQ